MRGRVVAHEPGAVVVMVGGLGMRVEVTSYDAEALGPEAEVTLFTQLLFVGAQEPQPRLFGFLSQEGRALWHLLRGISGIGPSVALRIVGAQPAPNEVVSAIARGDHAALKVKGVGPKLTKRIVAELKEKVGAVSLAAPALTASGSVRRPAPGPDRELEDAFLALRTLEFDVARARALLDLAREELEEGASADELVRVALLRS
ncbi:MAG: Holliday junction branch migration protein RuvA [Planctomycetota bacterium]